MSAKFIPTASGPSATGGQGGGGGASFSYVQASGGSEWNEGFADGTYRFHRFQSGGTSQLNISAGGAITIWAWGAAGGRGGQGGNNGGGGGSARTTITVEAGNILYTAVGRGGGGGNGCYGCWGGGGGGSNSSGNI